MEVSPGQFEALPTGFEFEAFDPQHPTQGFPFFVKACLRGIASGFGVSSNTLANDLEGVNLSTIRAGVLVEREECKAIQGWFIEQFCEPVFEAWLAWQLCVTLALPLPIAKLDKFNDPDWKPRRWPWVDPLKDVRRTCSLSSTVSVRGAQSSQKAAATLRTHSRKSQRTTNWLLLKS